MTSPAPASRDRYAQCDDTCTVDCGACKGAGRPASASQPTPTTVDRCVYLRNGGTCPTGSHVLAEQVTAAQDGQAERRELFSWLEDGTSVGVRATGDGAVRLVVNNDGEGAVADLDATAVAALAAALSSPPVPVPGPSLSQLRRLAVQTGGSSEDVPVPDPDVREAVARWLRDRVRQPAAKWERLQPAWQEYWLDLADELLAVVGQASRADEALSAVQLARFLRATGHPVWAQLVTSLAARPAVVQPAQPDDDGLRQRVESLAGQMQRWQPGDSFATGDGPITTMWADALRHILNGTSGDQQQDGDDRG